MASILNATTSSGLVTSADNSGSLQLQTNNGTTAVTISTAQIVTLANALPIASGGTGATSAGTALSNLGGLSGSSSQLAKAWVRFNNSGTISSSYNVSSITVNSTGYYTVNLTNALANADYSATATATASTGSNGNITATVFTDNSGNAVTPTTTTYAINTGVYGVGQFGTRFICSSVFSS